MESIWFYTFSTSAQVMAALVGLFAIFVVYKVQDFSELLNSTRREIKALLPYISGNTPTYRSIPQSELISVADDVLLDHFNKLLKLSVSKPGSVQISHPDFNQEKHDHFYSLVETKRNAFADLKNMLIIGFGIIGISLSLLVSTDLLIKSPVVTHFILWLFLALFLFSLCAIGKKIYEITIAVV